MKFGLGESYDKVDVLPKKIRAYGDITKPASTLGIMAGYLLASLFYFLYVGEGAMILSEWDTILYVMITVGFAHGASQAMNMAEDAEMDRNTPHKQNRPIPAGIISEEEARAVAWILILAALGRAYITNATFGVFMSVLIFFGVFYNLDPIRAKERIISIPWQAASRGLMSFPAVWAAYGDPWQPLPWILGLFMFFYVLGFQNSADIIDKEVDESYGIRTFVVEYGMDGVVKIASISLVGMLLTVLLGINGGIIPERHVTLLAMIPVCIVMLHYMKEYPEKVSDTTGNHPAWLWFYAGMVLTVSIPLITEYAV